MYRVYKMDLFKQPEVSKLVFGGRGRRIGESVELNKLVTYRTRLQKKKKKKWDWTR